MACQESREDRVLVGARILAPVADIVAMGFVVRMSGDTDGTNPRKGPNDGEESSSTKDRHRNEPRVARSHRVFCVALGSFELRDPSGGQDLSVGTDVGSNAGANHSRLSRWDRLEPSRHQRRRSMVSRRARGRYRSGRDVGRHIDVVEPVDVARPVEGHCTRS